jgi:glycosyltransferase involved in cell wall biosynthesis
LKIAFVTTQSTLVGGAHIHVRDIASALLRDGHEVKVFAGGRGTFQTLLDERGIPNASLVHMVRRIAPHKDLLALRELMQVLHEYAPDIVSTHSSKAGVIGRLAGHRLGIPTLYTAHGWSFTEGIPHAERWAYRWIERQIGKISPCIICVSEMDRRLALKYRVSHPTRIFTVHNGMPDVMERANPRATPPVIVSVARLDEQKDHRTLFLALADLKHLGWTLELVGEGPRRQMLEHLAMKAGIADRVRFLGANWNVAPILERAQIFALISRWEGFPRSTLEAMRAGLPCIVSDVGGAAEAIEEGVNGFTVARGNVLDVQTKLEALLTDPLLREAMGHRGRAIYEARFTFEPMYRRTVALYERLLGENVAELAA